MTMEQRWPGALAVALVALAGLASARDFDETTAQDILVYSSAAYCPISNVAAWSMKNSGCIERTAGFEIVQTFDATADTQRHHFPALSKGSMSHAFGFIGVDTDREWVVASFKGSNETADFITDLEGGNFDFRDCTINGNDVGKVHQGFCAYYESLVGQGFIDALVALQASYPSFPVMITGHSLGAAAGVLAAVDLYNTAGIKAQLVTFGQPRVGDHSFAKTVKSSVDSAFRVVHASDMVTHLPVCCALVGECSTATACPFHAPQEIWYNNDMTDSDFDTCDGSGEDSSCQNTINMSVDDHLHYYDIEVGDYCCF